jgi:hypothetical protein
VWNPWRALRDLAHIRLQWAPGHELPAGILATYNHDTAVLTMRHGMSQAQRRSVLTHELVHHDRGPVPGWQTPREERAVCKEAARRLIDFEDLARAMVWAGDEHELADMLWVDVATAVARLEALTVTESARLVQLLDDAELRIP